MTDHYLPDDTHAALADALASLDHDPVHPEALRDRIIWTLGEVGGIWPTSIHPDEVDKIAITDADKRTAKRYRTTLKTGDAMMDKLRGKGPSA